jgi:transcriptional regulator with PAS, ATPase and Fis domain
MRRREFREDLYYRLNVIEIRIPPLRERREEIPRLVSWFLATFNAEYGRRQELESTTMARLLDHSWPGNVRELENVIRRLVLFPDAGLAIDKTMAPPSNGSRVLGEVEVAESLREVARRAARDVERQKLADVLEEVSSNRAAAARQLKISYKTLLNKIAQHELTRTVGRQP